MQLPPYLTTLKTQHKQQGEGLQEAQEMKNNDDIVEGNEQQTVNCNQPKQKKRRKHGELRVAWETSRLEYQMNFLSFSNQQEREKPSFLINCMNSSQISYIKTYYIHAYANSY